MSADDQTWVTIQHYDELLAERDRLFEQLETLQRAVDRWDDRPDDCECREPHFVNFCERCGAEMSLSALASSPASRPKGGV